MEQSTAVDAPEITPQEEAAPDRTEARLFQFSEYVHVGDGSAECEHAEDGACSNIDHFHAWIRLPNKFQVAQIREKGQAARARVLRQAKDPESDRFAIIENQVDEAVNAGAESMIDELLGQSSWQKYAQAMRELVEDESDDEVSPWATIEEDQKRFRYLSALKDEEVDQDEFAELKRHLAKWNDALEARHAELIQPERDALTGSTLEELDKMIRHIAVEEQADAIFMRTFARWQMVVCTLKPRKDKQPNEKTFSNPAELEGSAPEIIAAIEAAFNALESELNARSALRAEGN